MVFNDFKKEIEDRVASPLRGAYLVTLILLNWRIFLTTIDLELRSADKIKYIESYFKFWLIPYDIQTTYLLVLPMAFALALNFLITNLEYHTQKYKLKKLKKLEEVNRHETELSKLAKEYKDKFNNLVSSVRDINSSFKSEINNVKQRGKTYIDMQRIEEKMKLLEQLLSEASSFQNNKQKKNKF